ncbi:5-formyltetrahydrofolate cyclo-ligase [Streptococcaceae bacterium ESL0729]|nr:5-formyltetrahydrofolate cyclo-ligase [Streptococcaceae bacterium ESL0729]
MKRKEISRQAMLEHLKKQNSLEKKKQEAYLSSKFLEHEQVFKAQKIGLFMSMPFEFDTSYLIKELRARGKDIFIPRVMGPGKMAFFPYEPDKLIRSKFGILEPRVSQEGVPDLLLVPGLVFDGESGYRIGYGGGFYDRYLSHFKGSTLSLAFDFQRDKIQAEVYDERVDEIFFYEGSEEDK